MSRSAPRRSALGAASRMALLLVIALLTLLPLL